MAHEWIISPVIYRSWGCSETPPEQPLIDWAMRFLSKDKVAVDIGAHVGDWAVSMAMHSKEVHAFEAQRKNYGLCVANCADYSNVIVHDVALGESCYPAKIYIDGIDSGGGTTSFWKQPAPVHTSGRIVSERVLVRPLDWFCIDNISFLKLDVEGAERLVLQGAVKTLEKSGWPPFIFEMWGGTGATNNYEWYRPEREKLTAYIKDELGYKITPVTWADMFLATRAE